MSARSRQPATKPIHHAPSFASPSSWRSARRRCRSRSRAISRCARRHSRALARIGSGLARYSSRRRFRRCSRFWGVRLARRHSRRRCRCRSFCSGVRLASRRRAFSDWRSRSRAFRPVRGPRRTTTQSSLEPLSMLDLALERVDPRPHSRLGEGRRFSPSSSAPGLHRTHSTRAEDECSTAGAPPPRTAQSPSHFSIRGT